MSNFKLTKELIVKALSEEQNAALFYKHLLTMTNDQENIDIIKGIYGDELKHYRVLSNLYKVLTKKKPELPSLHNPINKTYNEGLQKAILDELNASEFYRSIYLANDDKKIRDIFFELLNDEKIHAIKLNYLFSKYIEGKLNNM